MRLKARVKVVLRWAVVAARLGAASLGGAVIASSLDPQSVLALLGVVALVLGGAKWTRSGRSVLAPRIVISMAAVAAVRWAGGPMAAAFAAVLLLVGAWLHIRLADAVTGLAVLGAAIALLGQASVRVVLVFWLLGLGLALVQPVARRLWRRGAPRLDETSA